MIPEAALALLIERMDRIERILAVAFQMPETLDPVVQAAWRDVLALRAQHGVPADYAPEFTP